MARFTDTQVIEVVAGDNIVWEIEIEIDFDISGGCAPWKGSIYSCPSDVDWYGDPGDVEIEDARVISVTEYDDEGQGSDVELDAWEEAVVEQFAHDSIDDDALYEAAGDQADDDFDPPDPEPYDYDDYRY